MALFDTEHRCPICKNVFYAGEAWAYRIGEKKYCRYTCFRKAQKAREGQKRKNLSVVARAELEERIRKGDPVREIASCFGITENAVYYHKAKAGL